jgi:ferredoxin
MNKHRGTRVLLYRNKCIACGYCISLAPQLWTISSYDGKATSTTTSFYEEETQIVDVDGIDYTSLVQSVKICPVNAIKIIGGIE